jgi:hypothetical protein
VNRIRNRIVHFVIGGITKAVVAQTVREHGEISTGNPPYLISPYSFFDSSTPMGRCRWRVVATEPRSSKRDIRPK